MQLMVSGSEVSIPVKNGMARKVKWTVPLILAGNFRARWPTQGGSVTRRCATLPFSNKIPEEKKDTHLQRKLEAESSTILLRSLRSYHSLIETVGGSNINSYLPKSIQDQKKVDTVSFCVVSSFIQNGSSGKTVMYTEQKGAGMTIRELQYAIRMHLQKENKDEAEKVKTPSIQEIQLALATDDNLRVEQFHICKRAPQRSVPGEPYVAQYDDTYYCPSHRCLGQFYCSIGCRRTRDNCTCGAKNRTPLYWIHGLVLRSNWAQKRKLT